MASDRGNNRMAGRYDPMSRPFLRALKLIQDKANEHHVPLTLCGELSGKPLEAMALIALGYRSLSMSSSSVGPVKTMLLEMDVAKLRARLLPRLEPGRPTDDIRVMLRAFADEQGIVVQP
jgi:phosphotransferase system, enzyme I, PtsP